MVSTGNLIIAGDVIIVAHAPMLWLYTLLNFMQCMICLLYHVYLRIYLIAIYLACTP